MVVFFHINLSDGSEDIFAEIKSGPVRIPLNLKPSKQGITVELPSAKKTITPRDDRNNFARILSKNIFFEKTDMIMHLGSNRGFINKTIHFDNSIIMILALIENTSGFSLGLKDVSVYLGGEPGFNLDLRIRARIDLSGIISGGIKTILRR